jgi:hypothetical protein
VKERSKDKKSPPKQFKKRKEKRIIAEKLIPIFIECNDPRARETVQDLHNIIPCLAFKIVETIDEATVVILDSAKRAGEIQSRGWKGSIIINICQLKDIQSQKTKDGIIHHYVSIGYIGVFVHLNFNLSYSVRLRKEKRKKKKGR